MIIFFVGVRIVMERPGSTEIAVSAVNVVSEKSFE